MEDMAPEVEMEMGEDKVLEMMKILNKQGGLSPEVLKKHHVEDIVAGKVCAVPLPHEDSQLESFACLGSMLLQRNHHALTGER